MEMNKMISDLTEILRGQGMEALEAYNMSRFLLGADLKKEGK